MTIVTMAKDMKREAGTIAGLTAGVALVFMMAWGGLLPQVAPAFVSAAESVQVSLNAPAEVTSGSNFTATVNITQVVNFDATNYDVSFNPTVLRLNSVTSGNIGGTSIPIDIWNETSVGEFAIVQNVPGLKGVSGSGYLAVLHFSAIGSAGQSSNIILSNGVLSSTNATEIPANWLGVLVPIVSTGAIGQRPPPTPASFSVSDLSVTPLEVKPDEPVTISVSVTNTGGSEGGYTLILKVNGRQEAAKEIVLGARQITAAGFTIVKSAANTYTVDVNGQLGEFSVTALPAALPPPEKPPEKPLAKPKEVHAPEIPIEVEENQNLVPAKEAVPAAATAPAPPPPPASSPSVNWLVLGGIGGGVIVIGLFIFFHVSRRLY